MTDEGVRPTEEAANDGGPTTPAGTPVPPGLQELRCRVRAEIRAGRWKKRSCRRCPYVHFARGECRCRADLRRRKDLKRKVCKRCPARAFISDG